MRVVNMDAAETHLSRLVDDAAAGEQIVMAKPGRPVARLMPLQPRRPGLLEGKIWIADDFDAPLPETVMTAFRGEPR